MNKNNEKIILIVLIFLNFFGLFIFFSHPTPKETVPSQQNLNPIGKTYGVTQSVTILAGDVTAHLRIPPNTIFYDALIQAKNSGIITFSGNNYTGLGFFVTDIGTLRAGNGKNLLYYINGKEAIVGVSSYTLKDGDVIEWKLE